MKSTRSPLQNNWSNTETGWKSPLPCPRILENATWHSAKLVLSEVVCTVTDPSYMSLILLLLSAVTLVIILKYFRPILKICVSVVHYIVCQLLLLVTLTISIIMDY